ncbi:MAG TPA: serine hydrolase [Chryseolinea sp.]|nr:serine hydrolase [Chryseolinea sp.]
MIRPQPKLIFIGVISILFLFSCGKRRTGIEEEIRKELAKQPGTYGLAFKDLSTGEELFINEHEIFHAASTMKTPVMIEAFKQAKEGRFSLSDSVPIKNTFKSIVDGSEYSLDSAEDSEQKLYTLTSTKRTLDSLVYDMIIVSSNLATNIIIELVDAKKVTQSMRDLGANDIQVLRGVEDDKAFIEGLINSTTPYDLMVIFEKMANGETVSKQASDAMIDILLDQRFNTIIPAKLPKDVKVAHKTGSIKGVHHDSGIVFLPDGRKYVLVILSKNLKDDDAATAVMANVSEIIYKHVMGTNRSNQ